MDFWKLSIKIKMETILFCVCMSRAEIAWSMVCGVWGKKKVRSKLKV